MPASNRSVIRRIRTKRSAMMAAGSKWVVLVTLGILMMIAPLSSALPAKDEELSADVEAAEKLLVSK